MNRAVFLFLFFLMACQSAAVKKQHSDYPDLKKYFELEISRLSKGQPLVEKSVHINKQNEKKLSSAINWQEELNPFLISDIRKPAYKGLYTYRLEDGEHTYVATDENLRTREIKILKSANGNILRISIKNFSQNSLYSNSEYLEYCPDSIYQIVKRQDVLALGTNNFMIVGKFKK